MDEIHILDTQEFKLQIWFRYIDDVLFIQTHGKEKLEMFLKDFNNYHPNMKLTHEFNKESSPFLDLKVSLSGDKHQYLHFTSAHPDHTKRSSVFSQVLRIRRICSNKTDFKRHLDEMKSQFQARGYPEHLVQKKIANYKKNKNKIAMLNKINQND